MKKILLLILCTVVSVLTETSIILAADSDTLVIVQEDFAAFTEGTEATPATTDIASVTSGKLKNTLPGWQGSKVYEAGGCLKIGNNGNLRTANYNMASHSGNLRITFRVKALDTVGSLKVQLGFATPQTLYLNGNQWQEQEIILTGGTASSFLKFSPDLVIEGILIDDLKVESSEAFIATPEALLSLDADGKSFTARWKKVANATEYILNVYSQVDDEEPEMLLKDQIVTPTSGTTQTYKVEGLAEGKTYYYHVQAKKGEYLSGKSNEIEVVKVIKELAAPEATNATETSEQGFTANWNAVENAQAYDVYLSRREILTEDKRVEIIREDFSRIKSGSFDKPEYPRMYTFLDDYTHTQGWYGELTCTAEGYMGLSPFGEDKARITTPALHLAGNNGTFEVKIKMAARNYNGFTDGDSVMVYVYKGKEKTDSTKLTLNGDFKEYVVTSDKGSEETYITIDFLNGSDKLFIDEISISQDLKKGDAVVSFVSTTTVEEATSLRFDLPLNANVGYSYTVVALAKTIKPSYPDYVIAPIASAHSNEIIVTLVIDNISETEMDNRIKVYGGDGNIIVELTQPLPLYIYDMDGRLICTKEARQGRTLVSLPAGIYIVKAGNLSRKTIVV